VRRDSRVTLIATGPGKLRDLIAANYAAQPVPRSGANAVPLRHSLMTPGEAADALGVDPRTVMRWEAAGDLDSVRLPSGVRRYFRTQVEAIMRGSPLTPAQVRAVRERAASRPLRRRRG
jgi:DNA-binding XRE family transcriptional regulator